MNKRGWVAVAALGAVALYFMAKIKWTPPAAAQPYLADIIDALTLRFDLDVEVPDIEPVEAAAE